MDNILKLDKRKTATRLKTLSNNLFTQYNIPCTLTNKLAYGNGSTHTNETGMVSHVSISTSNTMPVRKSIIQLINPTVSDTDFAKVVINMYHEHMHCIQKNNLFKQEHPDENSMNQMIQEIACMYSNDYYLSDSNYRFNANEIQAEQYGIESAYEYLCDEFPDIPTDQLESIIVDIVNEKAHMTSYFIKDKQYASVDEILSAFDDAYDKSFMETRFYPVNIPLENTEDPVRRYIISHTDTRAAYLNCLSDDDIPRGLKQDRCIASVCMKLYPVIEKNYPGLQDTDLSYETCITKPYLIETGQTQPEPTETNKTIRSDAINELLSGIQMPEDDTEEISDDYNP
mgnify:CR=1 FL=1|jgi:hypothetical protein